MPKINRWFAVVTVMKNQGDIYDVDEMGEYQDINEIFTSMEEAELEVIKVRDELFKKRSDELDSDGCTYNEKVDDFNENYKVFIKAYNSTKYSLVKQK